MVQTFLVKSIAFNGVVWSLAVEASFYVVSPLLRRTPIQVVVALIVVSAAFYLLPTFEGSGIIYTVAIKANSAKYFWPYAMGFLLYYNRSTVLACALCATGCALAWLAEDQQLAAMTVGASFGVLLLARSGAGWNSRALDYLGDLSYPLYLVHLPTFILCYKLFGWTTPWVLLATASCVAIATYELIDIRLKRAGPACLNRLSASISGASAGIRPPRGAAEG